MMAAAEYQANLLQAWVWSQALAQLPLDEMLAAAKRADAYACFVDPTLYMANADKLGEDIRMLEAAARLSAAMQELAGRHGPQTGDQAEALGDASLLGRDTGMAATTPDG